MRAVNFILLLSLISLATVLASDLRQRNQTNEDDGATIIDDDDDVREFNKGHSPRNFQLSPFPLRTSKIPIVIGVLGTVAILTAIGMLAFYGINGRLSPPQHTTRDAAFQEQLDYETKHLRYHYPVERTFSSFLPSPNDFTAAFGAERGALLYKQIVLNNSLPTNLAVTENITIGNLMPKEFWQARIKDLVAYDSDGLLNTIGSMIGHPQAMWLAIKTLPLERAFHATFSMFRFLPNAKLGYRLTDYDEYVSFLKDHVPKFENYWSVNGHENEAIGIRIFLRRLTSIYHIVPLPMHTDISRLCPDSNNCDFNLNMAISGHDMIDHDRLTEAQRKLVMDGVGTDYWALMMQRAGKMPKAEGHKLALQVAKFIGNERTAFLAAMTFPEPELYDLVETILPDFYSYYRQDV